MVIAHLRKGELVVVDKLREMVRLAAGLTPSGNLSAEGQQKALDCLQRFGQRLKDMPPGSVRAVGTNTLRVARNSQEFLRLAEVALGHPIEIIAGIEEARLIYQGVSHSLATDGRRRLVMDIGGGSTEYIIGVDKTPINKESLHMGCVSMSLHQFPDGKITAKRFKRAVITAQTELEPIEKGFGKNQWDEAVGASGTLKTVQKLLIANGWSKEGITLEGLNRLIDTLLIAGHWEKIQLPELSPERKPIIPGGVAILAATFNSLGITHMRVSEGALREGLLYDLLGRINNYDIRDRTVAAMATRYHVDVEHAGRVKATALMLWEQTRFPSNPHFESPERWLGWASDLHEIGLDIAHSGYHKHSAYIVENADLPGFSKQDQVLLALLVREHRRKFTAKLFKELPEPLLGYARAMGLVMRLAALLNRSRHNNLPPNIVLSYGDLRLGLRFPPDWLSDHPLTEADLARETDYLQAVGITLTYA